MSDPYQKPKFILSVPKHQNYLLPSLYETNKVKVVHSCITNEVATKEIKGIMHTTLDKII